MTSPPSGVTLKVLIGMPFGDLLGGAERLLDAALGRAREFDLDVHVVFFADGPLVERIRGHGLRATVMPMPRHNDPFLTMLTIARMRRLLVREQPDVVLSWLARAHVWLGPAALLAGMGSRAAWWQWHIARGERLEPLVAAIPARCIVATSEAAAKAQGARRPRRRCVVVHPGIEPPSPVDPEEVDRLRERLEIPVGSRVIGVVARLVRWKGQDRFIRALALLRAQGHDVTGLVVGGTAYGIDSDYPGELHATARDVGVADSVVFTGYVPDALPHIALMDVLVSSTEGEPFGATLLEAMALDTPVVAVDSAGPAEIVDSGKSGLLVADGAPETLAAGIARVLSDDALRDRIVAGGRADFEERFTATRMAGDMARTLRAIASP